MNSLDEAAAGGDAMLATAAAPASAWRGGVSAAQAWLGRCLPRVEDGSTTAPTEQAGVAGQGTSDPRLSTFPGHWLVKYTLSSGTVRVMDPSYGTSPYDDSTTSGALLKWEDASLDGFRYREKDEYGQPTGPDRYMPDTKGVLEVVID